MVFTSEKYKPTGDFKPRVLKPDLRSCLVWFISLIVIIGIIVVIVLVFEK